MRELQSAKDRVRDVRLVDALKAIGVGEVVQPNVSLHPWGSWASLHTGPSFQNKLLEIKPGAKLGLHRYHNRSE
jgi:mannose-6-phosphate isomerase-like protein (cupin superfamily)